MYVPELVMEDPRPRNGTSSFPKSKGPCGGAHQGDVYYSAFPGRSNLIRWKIIHPIPEGNCTLRLSNGIDENDEKGYTVLNPVFDYSFQNYDGSYDYYSGDQSNYMRKFYSGGKFSCGRTDEDTFESIAVQFPNLTCEDWLLQMIVETKEGNIYQCSDIEVINSEMIDCLGTCQNEGFCVNGKCICRSGFIGDYCQFKTQEKLTYTPFLSYFLLIILAIIVAAVWYIVYRYIMLGGHKESWVSSEYKPRKSKHYPESSVPL